MNSKAQQEMRISVLENCISYITRKIENNYLFLFPDVPSWFMVDSEEKKMLVEEFLNHIQLYKDIEQEIQEYELQKQPEEDFKNLILTLKEVGALGPSGQKQPPKPVPMVPRIAQASVEVTRACNLTCQHCSVAAGKSRKDELTFEDIRAYLTEIIQLMKGRREVTITGGEPFLRSDIFKILGICSDLGFKRIMVLTNGTLIREDTGKKLGNLNKSIEEKNTPERLVQRLHVQVSIDGTEKTHDAIRGQNAWKRAVRGIKILKDNNIFTSLGMVVNRLNFNDVKGVIELAAELDCNVGFSSLIMTGRATERVLEPVPINKVIPIIINYLDQNPTHLKYLTNFPHSPYIIAFRNLIKFRYCGTGWATVYLDSGGNIYPCPLGATVPEFKAGNIREKPFLEIWQHAPILNRLRNLHVDTLNDRCAKCEIRYFCGGGCRTQAYLSTGKLDGIDPKCLLGENKGTAWGAFSLMVKYPQILEEISELGIVRLMEGLFEEVNT